MDVKGARLPSRKQLKGNTSGVINISKKGVCVPKSKVVRERLLGILGRAGTMQRFGRTGVLSVARIPLHLKALRALPRTFAHIGFLFEIAHMP